MKQHRVTGNIMAGRIGTDLIVPVFIGAVQYQKMQVFLFYHRQSLKEIKLTDMQFKKKQNNALNCWELEY